MLIQKKKLPRLFPRYNIFSFGPIHPEVASPINEEWWLSLSPDFSSLHISRYSTPLTII